MTEKPDLAWYRRLSNFRKEPIRCPFATVEACPRYYQSLSLLRETGATSILQKENERLEKKWMASDLWPRIEEQATSVFKLGDRLSSIAKFCPEVTHERFGVFCSDLSMYTDEIDKDSAHMFFKKEGAGPDDPRWQYQHATPLHYSSCPIYSVLAHRAEEAKEEKGNPGPWWREHMAQIISSMLIALISAGITKLLS